MERFCIHGVYIYINITMGFRDGLTPVLVDPLKRNGQTETTLISTKSPFQRSP